MPRREKLVKLWDRDGEAGQRAEVSFCEQQYGFMPKIMEKIEYFLRGAIQLERAGRSGLDVFRGQTNPLSVEGC